MQEFEYIGKENGQPTKGIILGDSPNDALRQLSQKGIHATSLKPRVRPGVQPTASRTFATAPPLVAAPARPAAKISFEGRSIGGERIEGHVQAATAVEAVRELDSKQIFPISLKQGEQDLFIRGKKAVDHEIFIVFTQIGELLKAGFTPYDAFGSIAQRTQNPAVAEALQAASHAALNGHRLSDSMELYPAVFEPGVVGMIRAGELGGYLPEAAARIGERAQQARTLRRWFWFYYPAMVNLLAMVPGAFIIPRMLVGTYEMTEANGGKISLTEGFSKYILGQYLPIVLSLFLVTGLFLWWWNKPAQRPRRHAACLRVPGMKGRAVNECLFDFFHNLGALTNAGLAPNQAWWVASRSVPNLVVARDLAQVGSNIRPESAMSSADVRHRYFPPEFYTMVFTGEKTGRMAEIMQQLANDADHRAKMFSGVIRVGSVHIVLTLSLIVGGLFVVLMAVAWYITLPKKVLDGLETRLVPTEFSAPADFKERSGVQYYY